MTMEEISEGIKESFIKPIVFSFTLLESLQSEVGTVMRLMHLGSKPWLRETATTLSAATKTFFAMSRLMLEWVTLIVGRAGWVSGQTPATISFKEGQLHNVGSIYSWICWGRESSQPSSRQHYPNWEAASKSGTKWLVTCYCEEKVKQINK